MSANSPKFSVVVPACARPEQLAECLMRLAPGAQTYPAQNYAVIVTDDSRDDAVRDLVKTRFAWAQWTAGPRRGPASNRNHGATVGQNEWIAFTDDDCLPEAGWLAGLAEAIAAHPVHAAWEGATRPVGTQKFVNETAPLNTHGGYLWSCNLAVRRADFAALKGFDERFAYASMEDVDFRERLKSGGRSFGFAAKAVVGHPWREQRGAKAFTRYRESFYLYLRLHPEMPVRTQGYIHLRLAARELLREWPPFLWRGRLHGSGTQLAKVAVHAGMGLRLWLAGRAPAN
ncbi:MAG TPA: glycosyltransferase [Opitutales bacterium]|nr:glycosyltransferase [Opitutales bacterium]